MPFHTPPTVTFLVVSIGHPSEPLAPPSSCQRSAMYSLRLMGLHASAVDASAMAGTVPANEAARARARVASERRAVTVRTAVSPLGS
ncbi:MULTISPECIES: hypothetical protein [Streptomyces]|uniref:hypothetical protein n=1 Tax=Streptomyces TaxID=1883 RepID=UPI001ABF6C7A|nr:MULTISPECIES: hypothetical protein [Streptomyces]MDI5911618.1 hypothetical protein [Streptomyces sp. 12257]